MRVSMKYNAVPTACETFGYGEVEDYTVNITGSGGLVMPGAIAENSDLAAEQVIEQVRVFPNPASQEATVNVWLGQQATVSIALTNLNGQGLYSETLQAEGGNFSHTIQVGHLPKGLYLVNIVTSLGEKKYVRLVIQ
jgi:hypothetical protein